MGKCSSDEQSYSQNDDNNQSDYFEQQKSQRKTAQHKEKPIKKNEKSNPKTTSKKQQKSSNTNTENRRKTEEKPKPLIEEKRQSIYHQQEDILDQLSEFEYPNHPNSYQNQVIENQESQEDNQGHYEMDDDIEDLRMMMVDLFNSIDQPNGLVFKKEFRVKLNKQHGPKMKFTEEHDLDPEGLEQTKIAPEVMDINLFKKVYHKTQMSDEQFSNYILKDVKQMKQLFTEASYIFCQEVTHQLYNILKKLCNIALEFRDKGSSKSEIVKKFRELGNKIASQDDKDHKYFFFGYQFVKLPENIKSEEDIKEQLKKDKYKYALHPKFRKPETQFANFTQKAGIHLLEKMTQLSCYKTFI